MASVPADQLSLYQESSCPAQTTSLKSEKAIKTEEIFF
jgi:hypothetical protein